MVKIGGNINLFSPFSLMRSKPHYSYYKNTAKTTWTKCDGNREEMENLMR